MLISYSYNTQVLLTVDGEAGNTDNLVMVATVVSHNQVLLGLLGVLKQPFCFCSDICSFSIEYDVSCVYCPFPAT